MLSASSNTPAVALTRRDIGSARHKLGKGNVPDVGEDGGGLLGNCASVRTKSAFNTFISYTGDVIQDTLVPYGNLDTNVDQYYFDATNGFSAVVSLEERSGTAGIVLRPLPSIFFAVGEVERDERAFLVHVLDFKWVLKSAR